MKQNKNTMEEDKYGMDPKGLNSSQNSKFFGEKNIWVKHIFVQKSNWVKKVSPFSMACFWTLRSTEGSLEIALVYPSMCLCVHVSVLKYLERHFISFL